jgi:long-chain fatty acid transport protein
MRFSPSRATIVAAGFLCVATTASATNGHLLHGSGAINAALGGAGTAKAQDVFGASLNPATLDELDDHASLGIEFFSPDRSLSSHVDAGAFGSTFGPPVDLDGSTRSDRRLSILPSMGVAWSPKESKYSFGAMFQGIAGFGVDYDESSFADPKGPNPILTPQPPNGYGFGHVFSEYKLLTLRLAVARPLTERLVVGLALVPAMSELQADPFPGTNPVDANGDGFPSYPNTGFDKSPGFGFQVGATWRVLDTLRLGASYSSPIWFEGFEWTVRDEGTQRRKIRFNMDVPAIVGVGIAWDLRSDTTLLADLRRIFYSGTNGFDKQGFAPDGSVQGFGWDDIWVLAMGVEHAWNEDLRLRAGYNYNTAPIGQSQTFFNVSAPAIMRHRLSFGAGYDVTEDWQVDVTYYHAFRERIEGPFYGPGGPIAGTEVSSAMDENSVTLQVTWHFGR